MIKLSTFLTLSLLPLLTFATEYECKQHPFKLMLKEQGFEHVNHTLLLNGETPIKELADNMWFILEVNCTGTGFHIVADHSQYNEHTEQEFELIILNDKEFKIKEIANLH